MDIFLECVVELVLDILVEGGKEVGMNKRVSKWIRYPILAVLTLLYTACILFLLIFGILMLPENAAAAVFFLAVGIFILAGTAVKLRKTYRKRYGNR